MYSIPDLHLKCVLAVSRPAGLPTREPTSSSCERRGAGRAGAPEPLELHQLRWELVSLLLERWETTEPPVRRDTASHEPLGNKEGHRALGSLTEISTQNATATTSLLFLEE